MIPTAPIFQINQLCKKFGAAVAVDHLSLNIGAGECLGLIGPNGAGKTTTMRMCLGLASPDEGSISAFGLPWPKRLQEAKLRMGVVSQFDTLDPDFTCTENLQVYGSYFGLSRRQLNERIPKLLAFASLQTKAHAKPAQLSGGMKRRLSLARALINDPDLLLLDEPTTGLDPQARHLMWERLQNLLQQGKSILLTTHFMEEAERLCHRLLIIDHGKEIAQGTPKALIAKHLETDVIEMYGVGDLDLASITASVAQLAQRIEKSGETVFLYTNQPQPLLEALVSRATLKVLHRPANLEDLFLKLTGRQIREA
jgi:lipooligosaccharide transport system ATP-binding protein